MVEHGTEKLYLNWGHLGDNGNAAAVTASKALRMRELRQQRKRWRG